MPNQNAFTRYLSRSTGAAVIALLSCVGSATAADVKAPTLAPAQAQAPALPPPPVQSAQAILGPGDTVRVVVLENPELTTEARLSVQGTVGLPLIGEVSVGNRSTIDAANVITESYRKGRYLRDPHVSVSLIETRSQRVLVLGHVVKPGQYALDGSSDRLTDILALAGGRADNGSDTVVITRRDGEPHRMEVDIAKMYRDGDLTRDIHLQTGDVIFVPEAPVFYVYGAVQRAGVYRLEPTTTVRAALSVGGGLTPKASQRSIRIHRKMPDGSTRELTARLADQIEANDVIFVKERLF
jgi:polysaccharide export outer membrane protein